MLVLEWIGVGVLALIVAVAALFFRRALMSRSGGMIRLDLRVSTMVDGRGWSPGFARFCDDELRWYRMFSFALRPKRVLHRAGLVIERRRSPEGQERLALPSDWLILRCTCHHAPVEIAMAQSTVMGFLSWVEAAPPGAASTRFMAQDGPATT